jgi:hypothetical protein
MLTIELSFVLHYASLYIWTHWEMQVYFHTFLTLALDGSEPSVSRSDHFTSWDWAPGISWKGDWPCPLIGLKPEIKLQMYSRTARSLVSLRKGVPPLKV